MPNYCSNVLIVSCKDVKKLDEFKSKLKFKYNNVVDFFETFVPAKSHEERVENWGTKWDACDCEMITNHDNIVFKFESAWSPPLNFLETIAEQYDTFKFELAYCEIGVQVYGVIKYKKRCRVHQSTTDMNEIFYIGDDDKDDEDENKEEKEILKTKMEKLKAKYDWKIVDGYFVYGDFLIFYEKYGMRNFGG